MINKNLPEPPQPPTQGFNLRFKDIGECLKFMRYRAWVDCYYQVSDKGYMVAMHYKLAEIERLMSLNNITDDPPPFLHKFLHQPYTPNRQDKQ